jgi:prepilin peptidase CpaA
MQQILLFLFCLAVIYGALTDVTRFKIPNAVSYGLVLLFLVRVAVDWPDIALSQHLLIFAVVFVMCVVFWQLRWMGGGDVKFVAATALWMGPEGALGFCILLTVASALFVSVLKFVRFWNPYFQNGALPQTIKALLLKSETAIPYGLPTAVAAVGMVFFLETN